MTLSTCEAEYMALASTIQESLYLRKQINELLGSPILEPTQVYCDNQSAIFLASNPFQNDRSKHIDIKYHFIRSEILSKNAKIS